MARYKIQFTFNSVPADGDTIEVHSPISTEIFFFDFWTYGNPVPTTNPVESIAGMVEQTNYNFREAVRAFYVNPTGGVWILTYGATQTEIEGEFTDPPVLGAALPAGVDWSVTLLSSIPNITSIDVQKNVANTCNKFDLLVTSDKLFTDLLQPIVESFPATLTRTISSVNRDEYIPVKIKDSDGETAQTVVQTPSFLNIGLIEVAIINNTVTITPFTRDLDPLEYSLDDSNWQEEPVFPGLSGGDFTLYIRDPYDCKINTTFSIEEGVDGVIVIPEPYFRYPKSNSLRMAERETWDYQTIHKNSSNTLSCETVNGMTYTEKQRYRSDDVVPIQLKSNYADLTVITSDDDVEQTIVQKSANMNVKSSMDCKIVDLGDSRHGIYFIAGKTYNYDTDADLLEDYNLNGELPQFGKVGNIITINSINYTIDAITFNQDLEVNQLEISSTALTGITDDEVKCIYNIFNYEVFEVDIDMSGRTVLNVQIWYGGIMEMVSELVLIDDLSTRLGMIKWSHKHNTEMFWATGIESFMRLLIASIKATPKNESENYETDSDIFQTSTDNYEADTIIFEPLTKELARLTILALSQSNVQINGVDYVKEGAPEIEALDDSNLYVITVTMVIKGTGQYKEEVDLSNTEIPTLLQTDLDGYIKII